MEATVSVVLGVAGCWLRRHRATCEMAPACDVGSCFQWVGEGRGRPSLTSVPARRMAAAQLQQQLLVPLLVLLRVFRRSVVFDCFLETELCTLGF